MTVASANWSWLSDVEKSSNVIPGIVSATDLKINKSVPLFLNDHIFSNTEPIYKNKVSYNPC